MSPDCMAVSPRRTKGAVREKTTPALRWIPISQSRGGYRPRSSARLWLWSHTVALRINSRMTSIMGESKPPTARASHPTLMIQVKRDTGK